MRAERGREGSAEKGLSYVLKNRVWMESAKGRDSGPRNEKTRQIHSSNTLTKRLFSGKCWFSPKGNSKINVKSRS